MRRRCLVVVAVLMFFDTGVLAEPAVVLDASSFWRVHYTFRPPVVREGKDLHTLPTLAGETPAPPSGWVSTGFDDSLWRRTPGDLFPLRNIGWRMDRTLLAESGITGSNGSSPALAMIALRGKFGVTNPAAVKDLKVSLAYQGGVVVTVNGREVGRANFAGNDPGPEALAEDYPTSAFLKANGSPVMDQAGVTRQKDPQVVSAFKSRTRRAEIPIPSRALRKGTNLLAVAIHRAAYVPGVSKWMEAKGIPQHQRYSFLWATCGMVSMKLESPSPRGLRLNVARPAGIQVWNSQVMQQDFDLDYGDPFEPLRPIRLVGSRDGVFSGKVVVGSDQPIKGLEARISNLVRKGGDGKVASSAVKVRYALPTGSEPYTASHYPAPADLLDGLSDAAPAVVALRPKPRGQWPFGAVCPVWVTAAVPRDAVPGDYTGTLTITARGLPKPVGVPVTMKVCAWRVPKPSEFRTIVDLIQSPESVAMHYEVPIYSNRHFQLLEKSLEHMGHVGNWTVHLPIICQTNLGNAQSMVRWIRKPDGTYRFDFSPMNRYLDLAEKHMGKPRIIFVMVWDFFLGTSGREKVHPEIQKVIPGVEDIPVTILDERTGKVNMGTVGRYDEKGKRHWKALVKEMMAHLRKRGMDKAVVLGMSNDVYPTNEIIAFWKELLPGVAWGRYGHFEKRSIGNGLAPIALQAHAFAPTWGNKPLYGWKRPDRTLLFFRVGFSRNNPRNTLPWDLSRLLGEITIQGPWRGFGRLGLDFWPVLKNRRGQTVGCIQGRYPKSTWRQLDGVLYCLVPPGPDGALASGKLEMMREGLQEIEARIFLEDVLTDPARRRKLPDALARRAKRVLDERVHALGVALENQPLAGFVKNPKPWLDGYGAGDFRVRQAGIFRQWYMESGWQQRSEDLYTVAAEVNAALAAPHR